MFHEDQWTRGGAHSEEGVGEFRGRVATWSWVGREVLMKGEMREDLQEVRFAC